MKINERKKRKERKRKKEKPKKEKEARDKKKKKKQSLANRIDEWSNDDEKKESFSAPDSSNGSGNQHISNDYQSEAMKQQNQQLKSRITKQMRGYSPAVPAKDVS